MDADTVKWQQHSARFDGLREDDVVATVFAQRLSVIT